MTDETPDGKNGTPIFLRLLGSWVRAAGNTGHDFRTLVGSHDDGTQASELFLRDYSVCFVRRSSDIFDPIHRQPATAPDIIRGSGGIQNRTALGLLEQLMEFVAEAVPSLRTVVLWTVAVLDDWVTEVRARMRTGTEVHQRTCVLQQAHGGEDIQWKWCVDTWRDSCVNNTHDFSVNVR